MMSNQASGFDYNKLLKEAQIRWLKPVEIHYFLQNHERYPIAQAAPHKPPSGSVFLFNKRVIRFFRKDGHIWRKKKDGRNVGEAHERLKVGNVDALNCYYAHGAQDPYFQRRSYWMLDPAYEHIVLVHYREVSEGRFLYKPMSTMATNSSSTFNQTTSVNNVQCQGIISGSRECEPNGSSCSPGTVEESSEDSPPISKEREKFSAISFDQPEQFTWQRTDPGRYDADNSPTKHQVLEGDLILQLPAAREFMLGSDNRIDSPTSISQFSEEKVQHVSGNITCGANSNAMKHREENSIEWMGHTDLSVSNNRYSSEFQEMWFDEGHSVLALREYSSLTVAQKQRFSIREISPEWAFSSESTKVIITGDFLCDPSECTWAVMFGSIEVPAEVVQEGVLRCHTPQHDAGKVPICLTSGNRESCSEVREFEFCAKPTTSNFAETSSKANVTNSDEEQSLLVRLVHILLYGSDALSTLEGSIETESGHSRTSKIEDRWSEITEALRVGSEFPSGTLDWIMHELLKDKLQQRLSSKYQGSEGTCGLPSKQEQGIIHMISGLGYDWALNPILDAGINIDCRDANGWTALHWAARFGREEMVVALLAAGASAQAVTDPTPQDPVGKTAGAIAAASGHTGLAGYLSEADLTSHLWCLTIEENEISKGSAEVEAERAVESISQRIGQMHVSGTEDELSFKDFLAAARNASLAAARIQAAFRAHSFRKRQEKIALSQYGCGLTLEEIHGLSASSMFRRPVRSSCDTKFDKAALSIQKKYRGWKRRKDFLTLRQHIVKIQAHVRGYQERKKYKEFLWTVSVLEKLILRWRRKGVGLRGYRAEPELTDEGEEEEDVVKVFRKQKVSPALDQAVSRVLSMVESPTARQQYRRMLERYRIAKAWDEGTSRLHEEDEIMERDGFIN